LPAWIPEEGCGKELLVPSEAAGNDGNYQSVDWWLAAFLLLEGWHERAREALGGPIHSYSGRLTGWDSRAWDSPWVNRIALFLRAWALRAQGGALDSVIGPLPVSSITMSHDVDALAKTLPIRLKQSAFECSNALRAVRKGDWRATRERLQQALRFIASGDDWWQVDEVLRLEREAGINAVFNVYADGRRTTPKRWLIDPRYSLSNPDGRRLLQSIRDSLAEQGLHGTYDSFDKEHLLTQQRALLESHLDRPVRRTRQHWLRFSWEQTWRAQAGAGLTKDSTLMFNDRPGFRNSAALAWYPWDPQSQGAHKVCAVQTILMDSHLYDYADHDEKSRAETLRRLVDQVVAVGGTAELLWHPHTLARDYGWSGGFRQSLATLGQLEGSSPQ